MNFEFNSIVSLHANVLTTALEVAASNAAIGNYKFEGERFELDKDGGNELTERDKKILEQFTIPSDNGEPLVVVHQANEGLLDSLAVMEVRQVISLINGSIGAIERNVRALRTMAIKMNATLKEAEKRLKGVSDLATVDIELEFGAYSRFFHIGDRVIKDDKSFIEGLFMHRAASDWCGMESTAVLKEVADIVLGVFPSVQRQLPRISEAIVGDAIDKVGKVFENHYSSDSLTGFGSSGYRLSGVKVPKQVNTPVDAQAIPKGAMFDSNVLLYIKPKKVDLKTLPYICTIARDDTAIRSEIKSFEIHKAKALKAIISHGVEITSNTITNLDALDGYIKDYLLPMKQAINYVNKASELIDGNDAKLLTHYAALARLLNDATTHPLLQCVWIDTRLARVIAGMAEAYFVRNPRDRTIFAKDIRAV